jgi:fatty acid desaturase
MEPIPSPPTLEPADLRAARRHVKRLRDFLQLCVTAVLVIALTAGVNVMTSPGRLWFLWVVLGFAIALGMAALETFGRDLWLGREWQERKMREFLARQAR